jgi:HD-GYP domain-containing protein (c-di-GMP phosphodiesterase class II)
LKSIYFKGSILDETTATAEVKMDLKPQYRIVIIHIALGSLWIFLSDLAVEQFFDLKKDCTLAQNLKGWFFIAFTGALLFLLIRNEINRISRLNTRLVKGYDQTIRGWVRVMEPKHKETMKHMERVTALTLELARLCGIKDQERLKEIERGAILHDIGKIGVSDAILVKPGRLDAHEWEEIKRHPQIAYDILTRIEFLRPSLDIPYSHHEKWDGSGYPEGLQGQDIPLAARIFAVVDVWDALINPRVYKPAWPEEQVLEYIHSQSGRHFDPHVVELFLKNYDRLKAKAKRI